jgi:4'-phosphopantetheinyl transferase
VSDSSWPRTRSTPALQPGAIHVWRVALDPPAGTLPDLETLLSDDERERAGRFYFEVDRGRYIVAHAALRDLLARYQHTSGYRTPFETGPYGKPALSAAAPLRFNLAHSGSLALVSLAMGTEVGVDLEALDPRTEIEGVASRFFSPTECRALLALRSEHRLAGFFHIWSQKEAYLKGRGDGVTLGLDHFDVTADPSLGAALLADRRDPDAARRWKLVALDAGEGFRAALAVEGAAPVVQRFEWS